MMGSRGKAKKLEEIPTPVLLCSAITLHELVGL